MEKKGESLEELLIRLRKEKNWTYDDVLYHLKDLTMDPKDIKKWESGLKYPELDRMYQLSELYKVPIEEFVKAKNTSYERGLTSIHMTIIKSLNYFLGVSFKVAMVLTTIFYIVALVGSFMFFMNAASSIRG